MIKSIKLLIGIMLFSPLIICARKDSSLVYETFKTTRIGSGHSTEVLWHNEVDFYIEHRFGEFSPGVSSIFNASDVRIGADYGFSNDLLIGAGLAKGSGPYIGLVDGYIKYKVLKQNTYDMPVSLSVLGTSSYATGDKSTDLTSAAAYSKTVHRMAYAFEILIARKFNDRLSMQLMPTVIHRNLVAFEDENTLGAIGIAGKIQVTKLFGITGEYYYLLDNKRSVAGVTYYDPLSIGFEFDTGGHVFRIALSNSAGLGETQFLPYTNTAWSKGGFRLGFKIGRVFKV